MLTALGGCALTVLMIHQRHAVVEALRFHVCRSVWPSHFTDATKMTGDAEGKPTASPIWPSWPVSVRSFRALNLQTLHVAHVGAGSVRTKRTHTTT